MIPQIVFTRPDGRPLPRLHHLHRFRGRYRIRVTVLEHEKLSGIRVVIPLYTRDEATACNMRDMVLSQLILHGLLARKVLIQERAAA